MTTDLAIVVYACVSLVVSTATAYFMARHGDANDEVMVGSFLALVAWPLACALAILWVAVAALVEVPIYFGRKHRRERAR